MNKKELAEKLILEGIRTDMYSLKGGLPNEAYCIDYEYEYGKWVVYYSERGNRNGLKYFDYENDACLYFYNLISNDSSFS